MSVVQLVYFFIYAVYGALLPFLPVLLHSKGLSDAEGNFVLSTIGFAAIIAPLLVAHGADLYWDVRRIIRTILGIAILIAPCWLGVSDVTGLSIVTFLFFLAYIPTLSLLDAHTLHSLGEGARTEFQNIRVMGSVGFILPTLIFTLFEPSNSTLQFYVVGVVILTGIISILLTRRLLPIPEQTSVSSAPSLHALGMSLRSPILGILWPAALAGVALAIFYNLYPRQLQEIGLEPGMTGVLFNIGVIFEILLMPFAGKLITRFGAERLVAVAIAAVMLRVFGLGISQGIVMAVISQLLHAPIIVGFFVVLPIILRERSAPESRYSLQGVQTLLFVGLARIIGPWIAGSILVTSESTPLQGFQNVFFVATALTGVALIWFLRANWAQVKQK